MVVEVNGYPVNVIMSNDMPYGMPEHIIDNQDGSYTVFLNARLNYETQREGFRHAIDHVMNKDYDKEDVQQIEMSAHGLQPDRGEILYAGGPGIDIPIEVVDLILEKAKTESRFRFLADMLTQKAM